MTEQRFDHPNDIYDRLSGDARLRHVDPAMADPQTAEDLERARAFVNQAIDRGVISASQLAKRTNLKEAAISQFRNNQWKGKASAQVVLASLLVRGLERVFQDMAAGETSIGGHVNTSFYENVHTLTQYAIKRKLIGAFVAPAGVGKSVALDAIAHDTPGSVLIAVRSRRATPKSFLQLWARGLGLQESGRAEDIQDRVITCLAGSARLTLVDEAHKLVIGSLDVIREVWDEVHCPIVLAGTPSFYQTLTSRRAGEATTELMDQLYSRVGIFRNLISLTNSQTGEPEPLVTRDDIVKLFARGRVRLVKDGIDFLCKLANHPGAGGLRICADLVQMVVDLYPGEGLTAGRLSSAMAMRAGTAEAGFTLAKVGALEPAAPPTRATGQGAKRSRRIRGR